MKTRQHNRAFFGGIVSPELHSRPDLDKYANGLKDCINMLPLPHGPVRRRPGFGITNRTKQVNARLIPFIYSSDQALVLEFGNLYMRVHAAGATLLETATNLSGVSIAAQGVFSYAGADPANMASGKWVYLSGIVGTVGTSYNGTFWKVSDYDSAANTFKLKDPYTDVYLSTTGLVYTSGGSFALVYELTTVFTTAQLREIRYSQSLDVMTLTHDDTGAYLLSRVGATNWTIAAEDYAAQVAFPDDARLYYDGTGASADSGSSNATQVAAENHHQAYKITAVVGGEESLASSPLLWSGGDQITAIGYTGSNLRVTLVTWPSNLDVGQWIYLYLSGTSAGATNEAIYTGYWYVVSLDSGNKRIFLGTIDNERQITSAQVASYPNIGVITGGTKLVFRASVRSDLTVAGKYNNLTWHPVAGADYYKVYKKSPSGNIFGYAGRVDTPVFVDKNVTPDITRTPPEDYEFFAGGNNPVSVGDFEQRRVYGGTANEPTTLYLSRSALQSNFFQSVPLQDDDAIVMKVVVGQQNAIRHVVPMADLLLLTSGSVERVYSTNGDPLTNENIMPRTVSSGGASHTTPIKAKSACIYEAAVGGHIHEIAFSGEQAGYQDSDVSVIAPHLFDGFTMLDMAFSRSPVPCAWVVRSDGALLSFTYLPEHTVTAWARHDTGSGTFTSVCSIPENNDDVLYAGTTRTVGGVAQGFIERMSQVFYPAAADESEYLDCHSIYDGAPATTINGLWALEGQTLSVLRDGVPHTDETVTNGAITLDEAGSYVIIGYKQTDVGVDLLPFYAQVDGLGVGVRKNVTNAWLRLEKSGAGTIGPDASVAATMVDIDVSSGDGWNSVTSLYSGNVDCPIIPEWSDDGSLSVRIDDPLPLTILSITQEIDWGE